MATNSDKAKIKELFIQKCELTGISKSKAAVQAGLTASAVSSVFKDNYNADDRNIWKKMAIWVEYRSSDWEGAPTFNYNMINSLLNKAKKGSQVYAVIGPAGCGKTHALKSYAANHKNVFHISCNEYWNRQAFLRDLLTQIGLDHRAKNQNEMMEVATKAILRMDAPVIILDEADKLNDTVLYFFITLYNRTEDHCGFVLAATDHFVVRLERGLRRNRKGYSEIWSRIGRKPVLLDPIKSKDVIAVCNANGVTDPLVHERIIKDSEGDLRRVKKSVFVATQENK